MDEATTTLPNNSKGMANLFCLILERAPGVRIPIIVAKIDSAGQEIIHE